MHATDEEDLTAGSDAGRGISEWVLRRGPGVRRGLLLGIIVGCPIIFVPELLFGAYTVPKVTLLLIGIAVVATVRALEIAYGASASGLTNLRWPALLVLGPVVISWLFSPYKEWTIFGQFQWWAGLLPYIGAVSLGVLTADAFAGRSMRVVWALLVAAGVVGVYGFLEIMGVAPISFFAGARYVDQVQSTIGNSNFVGAFLALGIPAAVGLWIVRAPRFRWAMALLVFMVLSWIFSGSQGAWAAAVGGVAVTSGLLLRARSARALKAGVVITVFVAIAVTGITAWSAIDPGNHAIPHTIRVRGRWWTQALRMAAASPIVGRGPNTFAVEGVRYRSPAEAVELAYTYVDDPHSVPMSLAANAGFLGLAGYIGAALWLLRRARRADPNDPAQAILIGCAVAAFLVSIGTVDETNLRIGLWTALGGLAAAQAPTASAATFVRRGGLRGGRLLAGAAVLIAAVFVVRSATLFLLADHNARLGANAFEKRDFPTGARYLERALELRADYEYRQLYAFNLGAEANARGTEGRPLIERMQRQFAFTDDFPQIRALITEGNRLHEYSVYAPELADEALILFERARAIDPHNPLIALEMADVWLARGKPDTALRLLLPFSRAVTVASKRYETYNGYWGAIAVAELQKGDESAARAALDHVIEEVPDCHLLLAEALLKPAEESPPSGIDRGLTFHCAAVMRQILTG